MRCLECNLLIPPETGSLSNTTIYGLTLSHIFNLIEFQRRCLTGCVVMSFTDTHYQICIILIARTLWHQPSCSTLAKLAEVCAHCDVTDAIVEHCDAMHKEQISHFIGWEIQITQEYQWVAHVQFYNKKKHMCGFLTQVFTIGSFQPTRPLYTEWVPSLTGDQVKVSVEEPIQIGFCFCPTFINQTQLLNPPKRPRGSAIVLDDCHDSSSLFWWPLSGLCDLTLRDWSRVWPTLTGLAKLMGWT